jgi:CMP/dCMP kinase
VSGGEPRRSIAISGDLGSGKSTVSVELSRRLGLRRVSVGDLHRELARSRGMSALQLNRHSERDAAIDAHLDQIQQELARTGEPLIVDSRLGWFFFADAFKVQLKADPTVAAQRVLARPATKTEAYASLEVAQRRLRERSESERARFIATYGVDKARLRNYSLVCDTTSASPDEVVSEIVGVYESERSTEPALVLDPERVYPSPRGHDDSGEPVLWVGQARSEFFALDGQANLSAALARGDHLVRASLVAESDEPLGGYASADAYFLAEVAPLTTPRAREPRNR